MAGKVQSLREARRRRNERVFGAWEDLPAGGRKYFYDVEGRMRWRARYNKEVDRDERTVRFWQEIYDKTGRLKEVHEKFPMDKGHRRIGEDEK